MRVLFFGDVVGQAGRKAVAAVLPRWRQRCRPDIVIANGENMAHGIGITPDTAAELFALDIHVITLGNHTFRKKEAAGLLGADPRVLRPANYPPGVPGHGFGVFPAGARPLAVLSLMGRVFMDPIDDPFRCALEQVPLLREQTPCIILDVHAEATSEKAALAWMLDGQVSAVIGTHTHVPTADARVLPGGTGFITDAGMCGPRDSILGVRTDIVLERFLTWMPVRFEPAGGPAIVSAVLVEIDEASGHAVTITRMEEVVDPAGTGSP
ncbi:MAG: TIGR00282 family metallophosphoesterase [Armatimonadota bacterium]